MPRSAGRIVVLLMVVAISLVVAPPAHALFHLMMITEVFAGTANEPAAQFIEMQMFAENQRFLASHQVVVYDRAGVESGRFTFTAPVDNGANQAYVLLATPEAEELFEVTPDLAIDAVMAPGGGQACFVDNQGSPIDCVSWGSYSGDAAESGTPFDSPVGLVGGQSMERIKTGGENPDALDAEDDTDDSAADFDSAPPSPTNNAGTSSQMEEHERSVTLSLRSRKRLTASGQVASDLAACEANTRIRLQRKASGRWRTVARGSTDERGAYEIKTDKRRGTYRARTPASVPEEGHRCLGGTSPQRKTG